MSSKTTLAIRVIVLILAGTVFALPVQAAAPSEPPLIQSDTPKTIDDLVALALDHEYTYRKAVEGENVVRMLKLSAFGQFLPSVSFSGNWFNTTLINSTVYDNLLNPIGVEDTDNSSSSTNISINETLFAGGQRWFAAKSAKYQLENIFLNTERSRDILIAQVKTTAYNFLLSQENLKNQQDILEQRKESLRLAKTRYETGDVIELDVMQAEIDLGNQKNAVLQAQQGVANAREALNITVGIDLNSSFPVKGDLTPMLPGANVDDLVNLALQERPDYKAQKNLVRINNYTVKQWTSGYLPQITAGVSMGRSQSARGSAYDFQFQPENQSRSIGFSLNWTIFDRFQREFNRQSAVVTKRQSMLDESALHQSVISGIRSEWRNLDNLFKQIQVLDQNRELARRQLELEQERYRVGASDQLSLRNAQVTYSQAENSYLGRVLDFFITLATLERDVSTSLEEVSR